MMQLYRLIIFFLLNPSTRSQVFQRRIDGITDFNRNWTSYKHGFGSLDHDKDFWLGNEKLFYLTNQRNYTLRVDIVSSASASKYEEHPSFKIGAENTSYRLIELGERIAGSSGLYFLV